MQILVDPGSERKILMFTEWKWKILIVADSPRKILVDPDTGSKTWKVTEWQWKILRIFLRWVVSSGILKDAERQR